MRKRILMMIPNTGGGGAQQSFVEVGCALAEHHEVHFCTFGALEKGTPPFDLPLHEMGIGGGRTLVGKVAALSRRVQYARRLKAELAIDVSISFLEGADYVNVLSRGKERVVMSIRGSKVHDVNIRGGLGVLRHRALIPLTLRQADRIAVLSSGIARELRDVYRVPERVPIEVIPNFFEPATLAGRAAAAVDPRAQRLFDERDVIVSHGRLAPEKNLGCLIDVLDGVRGMHPRAALLLLGDGPEKGALMAHARRRGLRVGEMNDARLASCDVIFVEHDDNPLRWVARSVLFGLTSSAEGFCRAMVEAMLVGLPVVSVDCPYGPRDILAPETTRPASLMRPEATTAGYLMPMLGPRAGTESMAAWQETVVRLLADREKRELLGARARERGQAFGRAGSIAKWRSMVE